MPQAGDTAERLPVRVVMDWCGGDCRLDHFMPAIAEGLRTVWERFDQDHPVEVVERNLPAVMRPDMDYPATFDARQQVV